MFSQAIFMIPTNPPPTFRKPELWSDEFTDFVKKCLVKNPEQRATATQLLQVGDGEERSFSFWPGWRLTPSVSPLCSCDWSAPIHQPGQTSHNPERSDHRGHGDEGQEAAGAAEGAGGGRRQLRTSPERSVVRRDCLFDWASGVVQEEETEVDSHTMVKSGSEGAGTMRATSTMSDGAQTMIEHGSTMLESDLGTMVINSDDDEEEEEEDQRSMRSEHPRMHKTEWKMLPSGFNSRCPPPTGHATSQQPMRPSFMDYFDKQDSNKAAQQQENYNHNQPQEPSYHIQSKNVFPDNWKVPQDGDFDFVSVICHECALLKIAKSK